MTGFDIKAAGWDLNPMHLDRSEAVAKQILERIPVHSYMKALEFGAGTGITSFLLKDYFREITMMDNSPEMVRKMKEKIDISNAQNLKAIIFDLEKNSWEGGKFDLILTQMVLHHVADIERILSKFFNMLNPGGFLTIADLYPEGGSFHGADFIGHKGFDTQKLSALIRKKGFKSISSRKCFTINKKISEGEIKQFDLFLLIANRT